MTDRGVRPLSIDGRLAEAGLPALPRGVWLEIDEAALAGNLAVVRELVGPRPAISAVIKADAYGHGLLPAARVFAAAGADRLCVASLDEALALRGAGVALPILVLFSIPPAEVARAAQARISIVASEATSFIATLEHWQADGPADAELDVHLEVETGLSRAGLPPDRVAELARRLIATPRVRLAGLWSHLASSESHAPTAAQQRAFERAAAALRAAGLDVPPRHIDATGGLFSGHAPVYEGVRVGLSLYGLLPQTLPIAPGARAQAARLRPAMALKCRPLRIEPLPAGTPVGYGGTWRTLRPALIATLPVGYGDGWQRSSAPHAQVLVRGVRVPLVGTVAMDAVMADVTDVAGVGLDDEFVFLGEQGSDRVDAHELARVRNTIPYEVVTSMAYRVPRVYHAGSVLLGLRTLTGESRVSDR